MQKRSIIYKREDGAEPYADYVDSLKNRHGAAKIRVRVTRAELGNLGDHRSVGSGVIELRLDVGPGYRVYIGIYGESLIVLLCAGDKGSQAKDIQRAADYWEDFKKRL